jgi:predicted tellurium resistance membrane protein TerC
MTFIAAIHTALNLITLTLLEVVLGIDNLLFLTIATEKLPRDIQKKTRRFGLLFALVTRLLLLGSIVLLTHLETPLVTLFSHPFSIRDAILVSGGLFLIYKSTQEIHAEIEVKIEEEEISQKSSYVSAGFIIFQIGILDVVFSLDSVFTAVGLTDQYWIMATAIIIAILAMIFLSETLSNFIHQHPTIKMLALSFLLLIGTILIADGFHYHVPRAYLYFSICFSILVEFFNTLVRRKTKKQQGR